MKLKKPTIMIMAPSPNLSTGYSIVGNHVWKGLINEGFEVFYLAMQTTGFQEDKYILPIGVSEGGADVIEDYIVENKIDILITLFDNWLPCYAYIKDVVEKHKIKWICHTTVNTIPAPKILINNIFSADLQIAPSDFVAQELKKYGLLNTKTIYHGIDSDIFVPAKNKDDKPFFFISVGTNKHYQKNWGSLIRAFKNMCDKYELNDVRLVCISEAYSPEGFDFSDMIKRYGNDKIILVDVKRNVGLTAERITEIYQQSHCLVSASTGESFGLPLLEAMSCGVPVIAPEYTATGELVKNSSAGFSVAKAYDMVIPFLTDSFLIDENDLIESMNLMYNLYNDKENCREDYDRMCNNGREFAIKYDWKNIIPLWTEAINEVFKPKLDYKNQDLGV